MKKAYIEPKNTVVSIQTEQFIAESILMSVTEVDGESGEAREVVISDETTIISRSAWQKW